jgi:uncharacterized UPF0160 family protein
LHCSHTPADCFSSLLTDSWRGVRDADLSGVTGVPGCVFCHAAGFIGVRRLPRLQMCTHHSSLISSRTTVSELQGNATKEGALEMAKKALAWA